METHGYPGDREDEAYGDFPSLSHPLLRKLNAIKAAEEDLMGHPDPDAFIPRFVAWCKKMFEEWRR